MVVFWHTKDPFMIARDRTRVRSDAHGPCDGPGDFSRVTIRQGIVITYFGTRKTHL